MTNYVLIGKGTTDASGVARMTQKTTDGGSTWSSTSGYVGSGKGEVDIVASIDKPISSGSVQSEPYTLWDTILHDEMNTDTTANYYYPSDVQGLAFDTDHFVLSVSGNNQYFQMGTTSSGITSDLGRFKGKKLKLQCDVETSANVRVSILEYGASSFTQTCNGDARNTDGTITVETPNAISDSCTRLYLRVQHTGWSSATINVRNLKLYQV